MTTNSFVSSRFSYVVKSTGYGYSTLSDFRETLTPLCDGRRSVSVTDIVRSTPRSEYTDMITTSYGRCLLQYLDVVGSTPRSEYTEMITTSYGRCSLQYLDVEVIQCLFYLPALIRHVTFPINTYTLTSTTSQCMWLYSVVSVRKINN